MIHREIEWQRTTPEEERFWSKMFSLYRDRESRSTTALGKHDPDGLSEPNRRRLVRLEQSKYPPWIDGKSRTEGE